MIGTPTGTEHCDMQTSSRYPETLRSASIIRRCSTFAKSNLSGPAAAPPPVIVTATKTGGRLTLQGSGEIWRVQNGSVLIEGLLSDVTGIMTETGRRLRFIRNAKALDYCSEGRGFRLWRRDGAPSPDPRNTDTRRLTLIRGCLKRVRNCGNESVHTGRQLALDQIRIHSPKIELFLSSCDPIASSVH